MYYFVLDISSKLLKSKHKQRYSSKYTNPTKKTIQADKENNPLPLMNRNGSYKPKEVLEKTGCHQDLSNAHDSSPSVPFDMANIAIRKNRVKDKRKPKTSLLQLSSNMLNISYSKIQIENSASQNHKDLSSEKITLHGLRTRSSFSLNVSGKSCDDCLDKQARRKFSDLSKCSFSSLSSTDIVESSMIEGESSNKVVKISHINKLNTRRCSNRLSGLSDTTLSTAYDSDSITKTCKKTVKTIQETPETDQSFDTSLKNKCGSSEVVLETPEADQSLSCSFKERNKHLNDTSFHTDKNTSRLKRSGSCDTGKKKLIDNDHVDLFREEIIVTSNIATASERPKRKLRSNGESSLTNMFKLESSIKNQPSSMNPKEVSNPIKKPRSTTAEKRKLSISPILKEVNTKDLDCKKIKLNELQGKKNSDKKLKNNELEAENTSKPDFQGFDGSKKRRKSSKINSHSSLANVNNSNPSLVLPTEVIPKSDHVRNWLKSTQETSIISISSESSFSSPATTVGKKLVGVKVKKHMFLSPRITKKMKIAKSTLNEEQQLFEDLYGSEMIER